MGSRQAKRLNPFPTRHRSFPRKDISRSAQAFQIAQALRLEVEDLESAGCRICQVDDPAIREGLPLKHERQEPYLKWATAAFRLATSVATPALQIVTHLCYSQFEEILPAIDALDGGCVSSAFSLSRLGAEGMECSSSRPSAHPKPQPTS